MPSSNADIVLNIDLDTTDVAKQSKMLRKSIEQSLTQGNSKKYTKELDEVKNKMRDVSAAAEALENRLKSIKRRKWDVGETDEYKKLTTDLQKAQNEATKLNDKLQIKKDIGAKTTTQAFKELELRANRANQAVTDIQDKIQALKDSGEAFTKIAPPELATTEKELGSLNTEMSQLIQRASQLGYIDYGASRLEVAGNVARKVGEVVGKGLLGALTLAGRATKRLADYLAKLSVRAVKSLASHMKQFAVNALQALNPLRSLFSEASRGAGNLSGALNNGFKTFIRYGFAVRSFFFLFRKLRALVIEGLQEMGNAYPAFGATIDNFKNALDTLKYTFVAAFAPIANVVIPILISLMNIIGGVITRISQLIAALTGQTTFLRAKAVTAQNNYTKSLGKTGKAAKSTKKAIDELTIAGFDDVEILKEANDAASGSGAGGGGGAGGGLGDDWAGAFEQVNIDQEIWDFAERFRALIKAQDWEGLGVLLGDGINSVFARAKEILNSKELYERIDLIMTAITTTFNSLVDTVNFNQIGETLAAGLNLIVHTLNRFWDGIDFSSLGLALASAINGFVTDFNWAEFGQLIYNKISGILDFINETFKNIDYNAIEDGIRTAIENIKPVELIQKVAETLGTVVGALGKLLYDLLIAPALDYLNEKIQEWTDMGGDIADGLLYGIASAFVDIAKWIKKNIWDPFVKGLRNIFDMHSPSKAMEPEGENISDGILNGIAKPFKNIKNWIKVNILKKIEKAFNKITLNVETAVSLVKDGWTTLREWVGEIGTKAVQLVKRGWTTLRSWVGEIGSKAFALAKQGWTTIREFVGDIGEKAFALAKKGWTTISAFVGEIGKKAVELTKKGWSSLSSFVGTAVTAAVSLTKRGWSSISGFVGTAVDAVVKLSKSGWSTIGNYVGTSVSVGIKLWKDSWSSISKFVGTSVSVGISLFKSGWSSLRRFFGLSGGGIVTDKGFKLLSSGGSITKSGLNWWNSIPKYASGTNSAHGTAFIAGEAGPEIVGHVGGRTEVLNKSQLAATMYNAVRDAMASAVNKLAGYISMQIANGANGIISALNHYSLRQNISSVIPQSTLDAVQSMAQTLTQVNATVARIPVPAMATGGVVPYSTTINTQSKLNDTLSAITDRLNTSSTNFTQDELYSILTDVIQRYMNVTFYIGDEQIARHANAGNLSISRRYRPTTNGN